MGKKKYIYYRIDDPTEEAVGSVYGDSLINARIRASMKKKLAFNKFVKLFEVKLKKPK